MTTNIDFEPTRGGNILNKGQFSASEQSRPEPGVLGDVVGLTEQQASRIRKYGSVVTGKPGQPAVETVCPAADSVHLYVNRFDSFVARADFGNFDMVSFATRTNGWDGNDTARATEWLDENRTAIDDFLDFKAIKSAGNWESDTMSVSIGLDAGDSKNVTFDLARAKLADSEGADYLREAVTNPKADFYDDLAGFIERYEDGDNCSACGGDLTDNEGYDGRCGDCADQAENDGEEYDDDED